MLWLRPFWLGDSDPFSGPALSAGAVLGYTWWGVFQFSVAFLVPCVLYVLGLLVLPRVEPGAGRTIAIIVAVLAPLTLLYAYPVLAADVFDYLMSGRLISALHLNPYTHVAAEAPSDPYFPPTGWKTLHSVYGPAFLVVSGAVTSIAGTSTLVALLLMKALSIVAHLATAALVYLMVRKLNPGKALFAFVAYAWNPLAVVYFGLDGHNDSLMLLFVAASLYLWLEGRWELSFLALAMAALTKFVPVILFPLLVWNARYDREAILRGLAISIAVAALFYLPFWAGTATFDGVRDQARMLTSSPASLAAFLVPDSWLRPVALLLFAAGYFVILKRRPAPLRGAYAVLLLYLVVLSFWTKAWYFTWPIALAAILGGDAFWVSVPGMLGLFASHLVGGWGWQMDWLRWQERWGIEALEVALTVTTFGGWLAGAVVITILRRRRRHRSATGPRLAKASGQTA